jgi:hypothetical protein
MIRLDDNPAAMKPLRPLLLAWVLLQSLFASLATHVRTAHAEVPILETNAPGGDYGLFEGGQYVDEPWFMWFVLGELSSASDVDMARFDYQAGERFKAEIFIPGHEELRSFNPYLALVGPGLPSPDQPLPFAIPDGMGAIVATSQATYDYFDIFTQMVYFPRAKIEVVMPQTGRYYVAVWGQPVGMARYALDIGIMENFAPHVLIRYPVTGGRCATFCAWGHWPIVLAPPLGVAGILWLLCRRAGAPRSKGQREQILATTGLVQRSGQLRPVGGPADRALWPASAADELGRQRDGLGAAGRAGVGAVRVDAAARAAEPARVRPRRSLCVGQWLRCALRPTPGRAMRQRWC